MVESKFVVLQMIPHTLFIEWDFGHYSQHCSREFYCSRHCLLVVLLFTSRWHCSLAVCEVTVHIYGTVSYIRYWSHILYYSYDQFFSLNVHF